MIDMLYNQTLPVNENSIFIERCPHDEENPYAMISRALIRDVSISPECRWLIIYFLSMKDGWKINMKQLVKEVRSHIGRDRVYALVNEAIEAGYMKRDESKSSKGRNKLSTKTIYYVSEKPKFKKCFRHPENQEAENIEGFRHPEIQDTENPDVKERTYPKKEHKEEERTPPISPKGGAADAAVGCEEKIPKVKRLKSEFSSKVREVGTQMLNIIVKHNPVYRPPDDLTKFLSAVESMLETDKQDANTLFRTFEWAVSDNEQRGDFKGWQGVICTNKKRGKTTNPAEIFKEHFAKIHSQMHSRPNRKFAPSSDDERAYQILKQMDATAI